MLKCKWCGSMELKKKYISKKGWNRVEERKAIYKQLKLGEYEGEISLIKLKKVKEPLYKEYDGETIKIADEGFYWLQLGLRGKNYWLTAMYDDNRKLLQYYIDITKENRIYSNGKSYFYDLFLDVVQLYNGKIFLLDEDELLEALTTKIINENDYKLAYEEAYRIKGQIEENNFEPIKICEACWEELLEDLEE